LIGCATFRLRRGAQPVYIAKFAEAIYVLHAFQKKTRKTALADIALARARFGELVKERRRPWGGN
jgi:phage-related protein